MALFLREQEIINDNARQDREYILNCVSSVRCVKRTLKKGLTNDPIKR